MCQSQDYQPYILPGELGEKTPQEWSRSEASAYAEWLHRCRGERVKALARFFGIDEFASPVSLLGPLGERVAAAVIRQPFSKNGKLTNLGHALGADMGLLLAAAIQHDHPDLRWEIVRKPKSDVSYNQPVLIGFGAVPLDPILVSMTQAFGIVMGRKDGAAWQGLFDYWSHQARKHGR